MKALRAIASRLEVNPEYLESGVEETELQARVADAELELRLGDSRLALEKFRELAGAEELARERALVERVTIGAALAAAGEGRHAEAIAHFEDALAEQRPAVAERPDLYAALGRSYAAVGERSRAVLLFRRCLDEIVHGDAVDGALHVRFATYLSYALTDVGDLAGAHEALVEALVHAEGLDDPYTLVRLYWSLARFHGVQGPPKVALGYYRKAISLLEATEDRFHLARAHEACGSALLDQGDAEPARAHLEIAERIYREQARRPFLGSVRVERARLELQTGEIEEARDSALEALDLLDAGAGDPDDVGDAWRTLAEVFARLGDKDLAEDSFRRAIESLSEGASVKYLADAYRSYADFLHSCERASEAFELMKRAVELTTRPSVSLRDERGSRALGPDRAR